MIILATIPVGLVGDAFQQGFQTFFGHPLYAAVFLAINGLILLAGERFRRRSSLAADEVADRQREDAVLVAAGRHSAGARAGAARA